MKSKLLILAVVISFTLSFCTKDELTLPTEVYFEFGMYSHYTAEQTGQEQKAGNSTSPFLLIDKGSLAIHTLEFDGKREEGKDVYFSSDFPGTLVADLGDNTTNFDLEFDIPQGVYSRIDISLYLENTQHMPLVLEGSVKMGVLDPLQIRFEYNYTDVISVRAINKQTGHTDITLRKDKPALAKVMVDSEYIFRFMDLSILANAELVDSDDGEVLLINEQHNTSLFNQLAARVSDSLIITFEYN